MITSKNISLNRWSMACRNSLMNGFQSTLCHQLDHFLWQKYGRNGQVVLMAVFQYESLKKIGQHNGRGMSQARRLRWPGGSWLIRRLLNHFPRKQTRMSSLLCGIFMTITPFHPVLYLTWGQHAVLLIICRTKQWVPQWLRASMYFSWWLLRMKSM